MVSSICCRNLVTATLDLFLGAGAVDDGRSFLANDDLSAFTEHVEGHAFQLDTDVLGDDLSLGQDRDVFQHRLAAVTEARRLYGGDLEAAAQLVDHQGRQGLGLNVLGDDQEWLGAPYDRLEHGQQRL